MPGSTSEKKEKSHSVDMQRVPLSPWLRIGNYQGPWKGGGGTIPGAHTRSGILSIPTSQGRKTFHQDFKQRPQKGTAPVIGTE